jgi:hypothetical protein
VPRCGKVRYITRRNPLIERLGVEQRDRSGDRASHWQYIVRHEIREETGLVKEERWTSSTALPMQRDDITGRRPRTRSVQHTYRGEDTKGGRRRRRQDSHTVALEASCTHARGNGSDGDAGRQIQIRSGARFLRAWPPPWAIHCRRNDEAVL